MVTERKRGLATREKKCRKKTKWLTCRTMNLKWKQAPKKKGRRRVPPKQRKSPKKKTLQKPRNLKRSNNQRSKMTSKTLTKKPSPNKNN